MSSKAHNRMLFFRPNSAVEVPGGPHNGGLARLRVVLKRDGFNMPGDEQLFLLLE